MTSISVIDGIENVTLPSIQDLTKLLNLEVSNGKKMENNNGASIPSK